MNRFATILLLVTSIIMCPAHVLSDDRETVAIIGTGDLGDSFGPRLAKLGYRVVYGSRNPDGDKVRALVAATGNGATALSQKEAAQQGDIVLLAVPWPAMETVAQNLGDLDGKIVIDVSFPWTQAADGYAESLVETSSAELIQAWNPGAKVVKGLTTMGSKIIDDPMAAGGPITIPVASDHRDAKERVAAIVVELGLDPVDVGPLRMARAIEAMDLIYMTPILQRRTEEWEFFFRRNAHFVCVWEDDWTAPVYDAGNLAEMPETQKPPVPCP